MKKFLSFLIVLAMLFSMVPAAVFADSEPTTVPKIIEVSFDGQKLDSKKPNQAVFASDSPKQFSVKNVYGQAIELDASIAPYDEAPVKMDLGTGETKTIDFDSLKTFTTGHYQISFDITIQIKEDDYTFEYAVFDFDYISKGTVAKVSIVDYNSDSPSEETTYHTSFETAIAKINSKCGLNNKNVEGTILLYADMTDGGTLTANATIDANGHKIGSVGTPLVVGGYVDFENLAGDFFVKAKNSDSLISIFKPEIGDGLNHVTLSLGEAPQTYNNGSIMYFWGYDDNPTYPSVSLSEDGYFAYQGAYGSIMIAKTTDYPYAILKNGSFMFYNNLHDALAATQDGDVYVMKYMHATDPTYEVSEYNYVGSLDDAISNEAILHLKTMIRVTDGYVSNYYTYNSAESVWKCVGTNAGTIVEIAEPYGNHYATLNALGSRTYNAELGGVNVKNEWGNQITSTTPITNPGSYVIAGRDNLTVSIDCSACSQDANPATFTFVSQNPNAVLDIKGDSSSTSNVLFDIVGDYKKITVDNAIARIGANLDYQIENGKTATNVNELIAEGSSSVTIGNDNEDQKYVASIGTVVLKDQSEASIEYVQIKPVNKYGFALSIDDEASALVFNSDIYMTGRNSNYLNMIAGIINNGFLGLLDTSITINNLGWNDSVIGIMNAPDASMMLDNTKATKTIALDRGIGIYSYDSNSVVIDAAKIDILEANPDGKAIGVYQCGGDLLLKTGYSLYDGESGASIDITVADSDGYGLYLEDESVETPTHWSITGEKDSIFIDAATAIYAESTNSYAPTFSQYNITSGRYYGEFDIVGKRGLAGINAAMPTANYYAKAINGGYEVVNEEYELHSYLMANTNNAEPFVLHSDINFGWGDNYNLETDYYNSFQPMIVSGNKAIDMNGYRIDSYTRTFGDGLLVVPEGASLWLYTTKPNVANGNEINVHNGYCVVCVEGAAKFVNGAKPGSGKYGVDLISETDKVENLDAFGSTALMQNGGHVDLYGGTYNGLVINGMGSMNVYGGNYNGLVEMFINEPGDGVSLYGGKFYPAISLVDATNDDLIVIMNMTALMSIFGYEDEYVYRAIQYDKAAEEQYEREDGTRIEPESYMLVDGTKLVAHGGSLTESNILLADFVTLTPNEGSGKTSYAEVVGYVFPREYSGGGSSKKEDPKEEDTKINFVDVKENSWFYENVLYVVKQGLMKGISSNVFDANGKTTRGMMMTILARMDGCDTEGGENWYSTGMSWAKTNGISDGTNPTGNITREQFASMLYRYAKANGRSVDKDTENINTLSFNDIFDVSSWATEGVHWCLATGIINGKSIGGVEGYVDPQGLLTRAEAAAMIQRFCELK